MWLFVREELSGSRSQKSSTPGGHHKESYDSAGQEVAVGAVGRTPKGLRKNNFSVYGQTIPTVIHLPVR